ncbi:MAG: DedA family protein [Flavobacteriales bacterium]|nr:DedA family protein [Flavobacteriales bacterium]
MDFFKNFIDYFLHLDENLKIILENYGSWTYGILFLIIFIETGLVIMPFLPGDSLLFVAGSFAALGNFNVVLLMLLLIVAAVAGDNTNYWIGKFFGDKAIQWKLRGKPLVNPKYITKTEKFYEKYGVKTIILARFVPIVRTFAPFIAGVGEMKYSRFLPYDILGGILWVCIATMAGYWFGQMEVVKKNFELVVIGIIFISVLPIFVEILRNKFKPKEEAQSN